MITQTTLKQSEKQSISGAQGQPNSSLNASYAPIDWNKFAKRYASFEEHMGQKPTADQRLEAALLGLISQGFQARR